MSNFVRNNVIAHRIHCQISSSKFCIGARNCYFYVKMDDVLVPAIKEEPNSDSESDPLSSNIDLRKVKEEDGGHERRHVPNNVEVPADNEMIEVKEEISIDEHEICLQNLDTVSPRTSL
ncbi:uncharacterized protein LOC111871080 isoform X6 [Cryptotermes secundus]|uniref:uncharacterized protein LOC111871080 isoform X6 n=1 Tax=Cryptotermes secundus TaxID=105785 RepID=UPI000CD7CE74|nr:uncharacterized protein LOC111871080 isoform X6 [Cryptotermes secundus]